MLTNPTLERLRAMRLGGFADGFARQLENSQMAQLSFEERFSLLVEQQWLERQNRALARRFKLARLAQRAALEDLDYKHPRGLERTVVKSLASSQWVVAHHNLIITGPCGVGKSYLACAFAHKAIRDGFTAYYTRAPRLFQELAAARGDGSLQQWLKRIAHTEVLVVDDWAMHPLSEMERRDFLEICEERYERCSTVLTSQFAVRNWHKQIGDPTIADSILDRLVHNAYRLELKGESMRKTKGPQGGNQS
jgi:DNA replication protein DnaC